MRLERTTHLTRIEFGDSFALVRLDPVDLGWCVESARGERVYGAPPWTRAQAERRALELVADRARATAEQWARDAADASHLLEVMS